MFSRALALVFLFQLCAYGQGEWVQGLESQDVQGASGVQGVGAQDESAYDGTPPEDVFAEDGRMLLGDRQHQRTEGRMLSKNTENKEGGDNTSGRHFEALFALMLLGSLGLY